MKFLLHLLESRKKKSQNPRNLGRVTGILEEWTVSQGQVHV